VSGTHKENNEMEGGGVMGPHHEVVDECGPALELPTKLVLN